jgi:hypothetical protein
MSISKGEIGRIFNFGTSYDMSGSTGLELKFTKPDGTEVTVTNLSTPAVTAPAVELTSDPDIGTQAASTYFQYINTSADFYDQAGTWTVCGTYVDGTPKRYMPVAAVSFTVYEGCG